MDGSLTFNDSDTWGVQQTWRNRTGWFCFLLWTWCYMSGTFFLFILQYIRLYALHNSHQSKHASYKYVLYVWLYSYINILFYVVTGIPWGHNPLAHDSIASAKRSSMEAETGGNPAWDWVLLLATWDVFTVSQQEPLWSVHLSEICVSY